MKFSICILAHHKPWLMMSSLISLSLQDNKDFDLHIIYIRGDGNNRDRDSYRKFYDISDRTQDFNPHLTNDDERILDILNNSGFKFTFHEFKNDHGLDSGAWYKFIQRRVWEEYDYSFFLMEGFIFTRPEVLSSVKKFVQSNKCDFVDMGFEKRYLKKELLENLTTRGDNISEMNYYHQEIINGVYKSFCQDKSFLKLYKDWSSCNLSGDENGIGFHHVPSMMYSLSDKLKLFKLNLLKGNRFLPPFGDFILESPSRKFHSRKDLGKFININGINFHSESSPYFFGCMCQHIFSKSFLKEMSMKYDENNLWKVADQPFSASALELIWGILPSWLGFKKWFFDGVHRPRKNFITFNREDDIDGACRYLNIYYKKHLKVSSDGDFIRIIKLKEKHEGLYEILGKNFF
jgi:hypothetical protein